MATIIRTPEDDKGELENRPEPLDTVRADIDRMFMELQSLEAQFKQNFQQSLATVALAVEAQIKEAVSAAEIAARK